MEYTNISGSVSTAEPWCPGPVYQSIWALDDGQPVVIDVRTSKQIIYRQPDPVPTRPNPGAVERASDILRRHWLSDNADRYHKHVVRPSEAEVSAAKYLMKWWETYLTTSAVYREAHTARTPLADKRFVALWKAEHDEHLTKADRSPPHRGT